MSQLAARAANPTVLRIEDNPRSFGCGLAALRHCVATGRPPSGDFCRLSPESSYNHPSVARSAIQMGSKTKIAIVIGAVLLLAVGLVLYFHQPPKPTRAQRVQRVQRVTELVGVGLQLRADPQAAGLVVQMVVPNSPAAAAGITTGLLVSKVDGVSLEGKSLAECVNLVRGPVGSTVKLELVAPDGSRTNTLELTRQKLKL